MTRSVGHSSLVVAALLAVVGSVLAGTGIENALPEIGIVALGPFVVQFLYATAAVLGFYGGYLLFSRFLLARSESKRRAHDVRNALRLVVGTLALVTVVGILTDQFLGVLLSLGVVGFAISFALQQPILSFSAGSTSYSSDRTASATASASETPRATSSKSTSSCRRCGR